ncbi:efflux RND transporter periplasmic adaptor subunit [Pseudomonas sp. McL0111]|uniref:efflux RND transporter periplasmic adaptor subunit n=1 Tax=Pseudomonas sp. McL0111 TaxID=3457357 RepID=UPI00403E509F
MNGAIFKGAALTALLLALGAAGGYWLARPSINAMPNSMQEQSAKAPGERKALYWYDPMFPQQKFDKPGKSPFMDMQLVPRYADGQASGAAITIDPALTQNLGMRLAPVSRGLSVTSLDAVGVLAFNERDMAVVQARTAGFVERVYGHAPGDVLKANAPLADILVPEWTAVQEELLALKQHGDTGLLAAARQRLQLAGMPASLIAKVERSGKVQSNFTVVTPIGGALLELDVREGMTLTAGQTLARVNGLSRVWLDVAVPEAQAGSIAPGQKVQARFSALPGELIQGTVSAILPQTRADTRTFQVRIELPNPQGQLRPGMSAQVNLERSTQQSVLWVPSEAVIRTGRRALVMLADDAGRYRPVEVQTGSDNDGKTIILQGLQEGQQVVASGQFLLDSEASLKGLVARPLDNMMDAEPAQNSGVQP